MRIDPSAEKMIIRAGEEGSFWKEAWGVAGEERRPVLGP